MTDPRLHIIEEVLRTWCYHGDAMTVVPGCPNPPTAEVVARQVLKKLDEHLRQSIGELGPVAFA